MEKIKKIININLIMIIGILLGFYLLVLAYLIPINKIKENVRTSIFTFYKEQVYYMTVEKYEGTKLDNYTDAIMLSNAMYDGNENAIDKAINGYRYKNNSEENPANQLIQFFVKPNMEWEKYSYARYWHGYLVFLKPALLLFEYSDIRMINKIAQTLLIIFIVYLSYKRNIQEYIFPFIISLLVIVPSAISLSLHFSTNFYIALISVIILLLFYEKLKSKEIYMFLMIGMITSFLDFLTCPILTLGMPLLYLLILKKNNWKEDIKDIVILSIMWVIGYVGMWAGKWLITSIFLQENFFINDIKNKIMERASNHTPFQRVSIIDVLGFNLKMIINVPNILMIIIYNIYILYKAYKTQDSRTNKEYLKIIPFLIIAVIPLVWYIFTRNHSFIHGWFTYRSLAVTVFAFLIGITKILIKDKENEILEKN